MGNDIFPRGNHIVGALFWALLCAASASAEVLVSEGCDMASDYAGAAAISQTERSTFWASVRP